MVPVSWRPASFWPSRLPITHCVAGIDPSAAVGRLADLFWIPWSYDLSPPAPAAPNVNDACFQLQLLISCPLPAPVVPVQLTDLK